MQSSRLWLIELIFLHLSLSFGNFGTHKTTDDWTFPMKKLMQYEDGPKKLISFN
jgi:hypothetical protein